MGVNNAGAAVVGIAEGAFVGLNDGAGAVGLGVVGVAVVGVAVGIDAGIVVGASVGAEDGRGSHILSLHTPL